MRALRRSAEWAACALAAVSVAGCAARLDGADWQGRLAEVDGAETRPEARAPLRAQGPATTVTAVGYTIERRRGEEVLESWTLELHGPAGRGHGAGTFTSTVRPGAGDVGVFRAKSPVWQGMVRARSSGGEWETDEIALALGFHGPALHDVAGRFLEWKEAGVEEAALGVSEARSLSGAFGALISLGSTVQNTSTLRSLAKRFVQWPSVLSLLSFQLEVGIAPDFEGVRRVGTAFGDGYALPVEMTINGDQAFVGELRIVDPGGALRLVAGVVEIVGFAPHRAEEILRIALVGEVPHAALAERPDAPRLPIEPELSESWELRGAEE
ncbi:MAG: hypothetical protein AAFU73_14685 [Planctomycetota bacterium]